MCLKFDDCRVGVWRVFGNCLEGLLWDGQIVHFGSKKILGLKEIFGLKKNILGLKNILGSKRFWVRKEVLGQKRILGLKKISGLKKKIEPERGFCPKKVLWSAAQPNLLSKKGIDMF